MKSARSRNYLPHARGDEPYGLPDPGYEEDICPTHVGMNRAVPAAGTLFGIFAPHMWGRTNCLLIFESLLALNLIGICKNINKTG